MWQQPANRKVGAQTLFWPWPVFPAGIIVFLVGSYLYVWLRVEPLLEYHCFGPFFYWQWAFFETFLNRPGGLANYAGVFLGQLNCLSWLGALLFFFFQCVILLAVLVNLMWISGRAPSFIALVPSFVLLLLRNRYGCPVPALSIGLFLALAASAAHILLSWRRLGLSAAASGLVSSVLFFIAGLWSALLYAVICGLFVFIQKRNWPAGLSCLVLALMAPILAVGAGCLDVTRLLNPWPKGVDWVLAAVLYASVPVAGAVLALLPKSCSDSPDGLDLISQQEAKLASMIGRWYHTRWIGYTGVVLAFLLGSSAVWLAFDQRQKLTAEIDYNTSCGQYEAVLAAARQIKMPNHSSQVRLHLALYHTGRLAEDLFSFHNSIDESPSEETARVWRAQSQPLFELGLVNDAEHNAHESLEMEGNRPDLLRLLARINLVKNRPQAAQIFLNVLSLIPFQKEHANTDWPAADPRVSASEHALLSLVRARMLTNDIVHEGLPMVPLLELLLATNPTNQMAFEYLMAYYLMDLDLEKAVQCLSLLDNFDYARIPRSYEEALLVYQQVKGVQVELKGRTIRPETIKRFRQLRDAVSQWDGTAESQAALAASFGDTYWHFYTTVQSRRKAAEGQTSAP